jgi:hypothetical protein
MEEYSKLFPTQFDVIDGDSYGIMTHDELEDDYFTPYRNDLNEQEIPYHEFQQDPQEHLSQQLSQLSMINNKNDDDDDDDLIPKYLQDELDKVTCTINRKDLRHRAYIRYEIGRCKLFYDLGSLYLQAGLGQLFSLQQQEPYWPYHETLIRQRLNDYKIKLNDYRKEYDDLCKIDTHLEHVIEKLVNDYGLIEIHMECQYTIALLYNKYQDHQLQVQYRKEASTKYQVTFYFSMFSNKFIFSPFIK